MTLRNGGQIALLRIEPNLRALKGARLLSSVERLGENLFGCHTVIEIITLAAKVLAAPVIVIFWSALHHRSHGQSPTRCASIEVRTLCMSWPSMDERAVMVAV